MTSEEDAPFQILIVDDEPDVEPLIRQRLRRQVRKGRYGLRFAGDGAEALEILSGDAHVDMVVTDINMPRMDGLSLLSELPGVVPDIKAIVVSAYGDMGNIRTAMNRGAFDFVTKPLDFADFEVTIERTRAHLAQWREAQRARDRLNALQGELDLASRMQQAILPAEFPADTRFDVHASMVPAKNVGGDFFDVVHLEHGRLGLAVADVSDKGIPAALFMMSSRAVLKGAAIGEHRPDRVLNEVNAFLHADNADQMFVTIFYGVYDPDTGAMAYANGGHCAPLVVRADGTTTELPGTRGVALGLKGGLVYSHKDAALEPGDTMIMYSDGVSEAMNASKQEFGSARIAALFERAPPKGAREATMRVITGVSDFAGAQPRSDDITCLALHRRTDGNGATP